MQPLGENESVLCNNMSEKELISACRNGDKLAMKTLYESYFSVMLGICKRYAPTKLSAEDLLHDGFIKIFKDIGSFSGKGSFEGWMKKVMINTVLSHLRKEKKEISVDFHESSVLDSSDDEAPTSTETEMILNAEFTKEELIEILKTMPSGYQKVMNLYVIDDFRHDEIAEMLGISVGTSKSQLNRGRKMMKSKLIKIALERNKA